MINSHAALKVFIAVTVAGVLGACQSDGDTYQDISGKNIGSVEIEDLHPLDISIGLPRSPEIKIHSAKSYTYQNQSYKEVITFDEGFVDYQKAPPGRHFEFADNIDIERFKKKFSSYGFIKNHHIDNLDNFNKEDNLTYANIPTNGGDCIIFTKAFGKASPGGMDTPNKVINGMWCGSINENSSDVEEEAVLFAKGI